jgi:hypothetical protein
VVGRAAVWIGAAPPANPKAVNNSNVKRRIHWFISCAAITGLMAVTGCNTISLQTNQYIGVPTYPPTDPATIQVMRTEPTRPNVKLGEITVEPSSMNTPVAKIESKLQEAAAKMGANAVVIVVDRTQNMGAVVTGGWYNRQISPVIGRVIVGVAIHYTQP